METTITNDTKVKKKQIIVEKQVWLDLINLKNNHGYSSISKMLETMIKLNKERMEAKNGNSRNN
jgi:hypothetical protein